MELGKAAATARYMRAMPTGKKAGRARSATGNATKWWGATRLLAGLGTARGHGAWAKQDAHSQPATGIHVDNGVGNVRAWVGVCVCVCVGGGNNEVSTCNAHATLRAGAPIKERGGK